MKQILIETQTFTAKPVTLTEGKSEKGNLLVKGVLATAEVKNGNGRYYSNWMMRVSHLMFTSKYKRTQII